MGKRGEGQLAIRGPEVIRPHTRFPQRGRTGGPEQRGLLVAMVLLLETLAGLSAQIVPDSLTGECLRPGLWGPRCCLAQPHIWNSAFLRLSQ